MDILYYSNYCKHSQKVLQFLVKGNMTDKLNFICIDKRVRDENNNQLYIVLENGKRVIMPPNVHSVPALLQVKHNYKVVLGDDIIKYFEPAVANKIQSATEINGEPTGFQLQASNQGMYIVSETFTPYNMSPEELSAKGKGVNRSLYNYVKASDDVLSIPTPPDTYRPDKVASNVTIDVLEQKRFQDIPQNIAAATSPFTG
jgi:hypothetical protein